MRIRLLSDLHLEYGDFSPPEVAADVVALVGDIAVGPIRGIAWAEPHFPDVPVLMVPGNHEFYHHHLGRTLARMKEAAETTSNVRVLDNDDAYIGGVRFLGATLWTDYCMFGEDCREEVMEYCATCIRDHSVIGCGEPRAPRIFAPADALQLHAESVAWLESKLAEPFKGRTVVLTHHAPHMESVAPQFAQDPCSGAFVSNLDRLMGPPVDLWLHGHTHDVFRYEVRGTRVFCNPRGYSHQEYEGTRGFDPRLVIAL